MEPDQLELGEVLRDEGIARVEANHGNDWAQRADDAIAALVSRRLPFTADDVREMAGDPPHPNLLGARLRAWSQSGRIVHWGWQRATRAERHASVLGVWIAS